MRYIKLGRTGLDVSPIALGAMTYGEPGRGHPAGRLPRRRVVRSSGRRWRPGINFFDTANMYSQGSSEEILGRALEDFADRDEIVIATKVRHPMRPGPNGAGLSRKAILTEIDHSLRRLGTDYVDLYQIHRMDNRDPDRGDARGPARRREGRQGPLHRRLVDACVGVQQGATPAAPAWLGAVRLHAGPLQSAGPRGGAGDAAAVRRRGDRHDRRGARSPAAASPATGTTTERSATDPFADMLYTNAEATARSSTRSAGIAAARGVSRAQVALAWLRRNPVVVAPLVGASKTCPARRRRGLARDRPDRRGGRRARSALHAALRLPGHLRRRRTRTHHGPPPGLRPGPRLTDPPRSLATQSPAPGSHRRPGAHCPLPGRQP